MKKTIQLIDKQDQVLISFANENDLVFAGGEGQPGRIEVRNQAGEPTLKMEATYGNLVAGGNGTDGDIILLDQENRARVLLGANEAAFKVKDEAGQIRVKVDGKKSDIFVKVENFPAQPDVLPFPGEIINFLDENGHLPGMPSREKLAEGFYLKGFSIRLLNEFEILTRIVAQQNEVIGRLIKKLPV
ncbi:MAG: hypothetical protein H6581_13880 [Bacteroidia bacterium]|nr:hypothetical protein [Bacteroidia bacterium]